MADIAMLVAEDYERRLRVSRNKIGSDTEKQIEIDLVSWVANLGQKVKADLGQQRIEVLKLALEPKSQIGAEAFNGAFSA
ncbi:RING/FYVE/PHD zinc finger superfamily protein [Hibiscus syriacus]|uniref:RING/FYVE/PHD zinc finger superfamily protein n=1 Tax=Hibiscus syriacus TaxID=106335 RepID=A0A6A3ARP3_HIBSY|nr:RING/FYVE/PHD zinc finger superfamily protein [Hibiscus syriacus]